MKNCDGCGQDIADDADHDEDACWAAAVERADRQRKNRQPIEDPARPTIHDPWERPATGAPLTGYQNGNAAVLAWAEAREAELAASTVHCGRCGEKKLTEQSSCGRCWQEDDERRTRERKERELRAAAEIPPYFDKATFSAIEAGTWTVKDRKAVQAMRDAVAARAPWVTLCGNTFAGKTSLAIAGLREFLMAGRDCLFVDAQELAHAHAEYGQEPQLVRSALRRDIVLLDDLGQDARLASDWVSHVIHGRHRARRTTIVTTGLTADQIAAKYSSGTMRRIYTDCVLIEVAAAPLAIQGGRQLRAVPGPRR